MIDGLPADMVALALPLDVDKIVSAGLIRPNWTKAYPNNSVGEPKHTVQQGGLDSWPGGAPLSGQERSRLVGRAEATSLSRSLAECTCRGVHKRQLRGC